MDESCLHRGSPWLRVLAMAVVCGCGAPDDAGMDAGPLHDGGPSAPDAPPADAGTMPDAGSMPDGGALDSGPPTCGELDCDDGLDCTTDGCTDGMCTHEVSHEACGEGAYCDATLGCVGGTACATDADCPPSPGGCFGSARCVPDTRTCTYPVLDGDMDGHGPPVCGGMDCDDTDPTVHPGAPDPCNGVDDDCNGSIDAPLPPRACRPDQACVSGACGCAPDAVECGGVCRDLLVDEDHCGACNARCGDNEVCDGGECACPAPYTNCGSAAYPACVLRDSDPDHCGVCGFSCPDGADCVGGTCACPAGETECPGRCAPLGTTSDCTACGDACAPGASCTPTGCSPRFPWVTAYEERYSASASSYPGSVAVAPDGSVVHASPYSRGLYELGAFSTTIAGGEMFVWKHDASGARQWAHRWSIPGTGSPGVVDVEVGDDGTIYVLLQVRSTLELHDGTSVSVGYYGRALLVALSAAGDVLWHRDSGGTATAHDLEVVGSEITILAASTAAVDFGGGSMPAGDGSTVVATLNPSGGQVSAFRLPGVAEHLARHGSSVWLGGRFTGSLVLGATTLTSVGSGADIYAVEATMTGSVLHAFRFGLSSTDYLADLAVLSGGDVLLATNATTVARFTPAGAVVWYVPPGYGTRELDVDASDRVYVSSYGSAEAHVELYDASGMLETELSFDVHGITTDARGATAAFAGTWDHSFRVGQHTGRSTYSGAPGVWISQMEAP